MLQARCGHPARLHCPVPRRLCLGGHQPKLVQPLTTDGTWQRGSGFLAAACQLRRTHAAPPGPPPVAEQSRCLPPAAARLVAHFKPNTLISSLSFRKRTSSFTTRSRPPCHVPPLSNARLTSSFPTPHRARHPSMQLPHQTARCTLPCSHRILSCHPLYLFYSLSSLLSLTWFYSRRCPRPCHLRASRALCHICFPILKPIQYGVITSPAETSALPVAWKPLQTCRSVERCRWSCSAPRVEREARREARAKRRQSGGKVLMWLLLPVPCIHFPFATAALAATLTLHHACIPKGPLTLSSQSQSSHFTAFRNKAAACLLQASSHWQACRRAAAAALPAACRGVPAPPAAAGNARRQLTAMHSVAQQAPFTARPCAPAPPPCPGRETLPGGCGRAPPAAHIGCGRRQPPVGGGRENCTTPRHLNRGACGQPDVNVINRGCPGRAPPHRSGPLPARWRGGGRGGPLPCPARLRPRPRRRGPPPRPGGGQAGRGLSDADAGGEARAEASKALQALHVPSQLVPIPPSPGSPILAETLRRPTCSCADRTCASFPAAAGLEPGPPPPPTAPFGLSPAAAIAGEGEGAEL